MKTYENFMQDSYSAMLKMVEYLEQKGYNPKCYTNINGNHTVSVTLDDKGEPQEYVAIFERV